MKFIAWLNGVCSIGFFGWLCLLGHGLWFHNKDYIASGILFGIFTLIGFVVTLDAMSTEILLRRDE